MEEIKLANQISKGKTVVIFTEGTILKPKSWFSLYQHNSYIPIGNSVNHIKGWHEQGGNIIYLTSRRGKQAENVAEILRKHAFRGSKLIFRSKNEKYKDIIEKIQPDILIEDDCRSIGGAWQMCITYVDKSIKDNIISITVKEFKGIDELPINLADLKMGR